MKNWVVGFFENGKVGEKMSSMENVYNMIYNDEKIRSIYNSINQRENNNKNAWCHHNFNHVSNVKDLVVEIMTKLDCNKELIEEAKIAAILHDTGAIEGKENHAYRSYEFAKKYLKENGINLPDEELVLEAIKKHSDGFNTENTIQLALILADKLDIKFTRPTKVGLEIPGNRQFGNIKDIHIDIDKNSLNIYFISKENLNKKELEQYYFIEKVSNAIKSFSSKFNLNYKIYLDKTEWFEIY